MRKNFTPLVLILLLVAAAAVNTRAQNALPQPVPDATQLATTKSAGVAATTRASTTVPQGVINSLSSLPEADGLIYVNTQRILNEALPKFLPAKDLEEIGRAHV